MATFQKGEILETFFRKLISRVPGLQLVLLTDRDGVELLKVSNGDYKENVLCSTMAATFASASEQASKLKLGINQTITSFVENEVVVQISYLPVVISLFGDETMNPGLLISFAPEIRNILEPLQASIKQADPSIHL